MTKQLSDRDYALKHRYRVEAGGEFVPGVTSVINIMDKPALMWKSSEIAAQTAIALHDRRVEIANAHRATLLASRGRGDSTRKKQLLGETGSDDEVFAHYCRGEFDRIWKGKAKLGNRVHDIAEAWSTGASVPVAPDESAYVDALEKFHTRYHPAFELAEAIVINPAKFYGGRFDAIVTLDGPESQGRFLIDYKTGGEYPLNTAIQMYGYMTARLARFDGAGTLTEPSDLPKLDGARIVYLQPDGQVAVKNPFDRVTWEDAEAAFDAALALYRVTTKINKSLEGAQDE